MRLFQRTLRPKDLSDEALIAKYQEDENPLWLGELYDRYTHLVFLVCMKYLKDELESEDMCMRVFEKLMKDLKKYEIKLFRPWLHTVVKNQCLVYLDRKKRQKTKEEVYQQEIIRDRPELLGTPFELKPAEEREAQLRLMEASLGFLKQEQQICLDLFYLKQKSYQEVAEQTGFTLKQVKSHIQNGKRMLRKHMESQSPNGDNYIA